MKNLSMTKLDKAIKFATGKTTTVSIMKNDEESIDVEVRSVISLAEMSQLVRTAVDNLFTENEYGEIEYMPELEDVSIAANVMAYYTNLKDDLGNDRLVELIYNTGIYDEIVEHISESQYSNIQWAVRNRARDRIADNRNTQRAALAKATMQIEYASEAFKALTDQFADFGTDRMQAVLDRLSSIEVKDLAKAVVETHDNVTPIR